MFCLLKNKSVIYKPKPQVWGVGAVYGLDFKLFHVQVGNEGADRGTHGCTIDLFITLTLKRKYIFETKL